MCSCGLEPKTTRYYHLRCNLYSNVRTERLNDACALSPTLKSLSHEKLLSIFLHELDNFSFNTNKKIKKSTIKFLKTLERLIGPLFWPFISQRIFNEQYFLTLIWVEFLGVCFEMEGRRSKITPTPPFPSPIPTLLSPPCLKLVKIMLET